MLLEHEFIASNEPIESRDTRICLATIIYRLGDSTQNKS